MAATIATLPTRTLTLATAGVPLAILAMLAMVVVPLPPLLLDVLFTFNIVLSLVVILAVVYVMRPLEFAIFPTVLLLASRARWPRRRYRPRQPPRVRCRS